MTNEEKIKAWCEYDSNNMDMYELIVAGEREKMQGVALTPDEIEMIKNCLPYGVTNLKFCIKSDVNLYNKYLE